MGSWPGAEGTARTLNIMSSSSREKAENDASRRGVYTASRASALAGVPLSTVYEWARAPRSLILPSVSASRVKLWSWTDLVALRAVYWLRHPLHDERHATSMSVVKQMIRRVEQRADGLGEALVSESMILRVDGRGRVYLESEEIMTVSPDWTQSVERDLTVDLLSTFGVDGSLVGPNLRTPRSHLRIVPGKLAGEPHVAETRIETRVLAALKRRAMPESDIIELYPGLTAATLSESLDLEQQLERNLNAVA